MVLKGVYHIIYFLIDSGANQAKLNKKIIFKIAPAELEIFRKEHQVVAQRYEAIQKWKNVLDSQIFKQYF